MRLRDVRVEETLFQLDLPEGFSWRSESGGGAALSYQPPGVLHFSAEPVENPEELPNLSRMLANFVTLHVKPVATDQLLRFQLENSLGFAWQYKEELEGGESRLWRVWVVGNRQVYVFVSFNCALEHQEQFQPLVDEAVRSIKLRAC